MILQQSVKSFKTLVFPAILNSYSVIFFFNNKLMAFALLLISFFNFYAGLSGLIAVILSVIIANALGFDKSMLKKGLFSFNALLTGIGMGTFFDPGWVFFTMLALASLLTLMLSVTLSNWLNKYGLPILSIPFVVTFWFIILPSAQFENLGLTQRNIYWINEMYSMGGNSLLNFYESVNSLPVHNLIDIYLRSMSSIFFQDNLITGLIISLAILMCSRISFSLSVIGFLSAYYFALFTGSGTASINYYNIGANYIMVAIAVGGFFVIPSRYSYLWTILLVPLTTLALLFFSKLFEFFQLPIFSLPFSFVVILFVYFLNLRTKVSKMFLTPIQHYSPETNLYSFNKSKSMYNVLRYFPLQLPFWGEWTITQGYDGEHTHKGDWGKAFDFEIHDENNKSHTSNGLLCENYYCYNKPVLAPADGFVEEIFDHIDDNEIGKVNTFNNWGNTIIIRHLNGLYTQLSHLKKGTFKVAKGDFVKQGDILAHCGNSGRSPIPHLHYQVQEFPVLGAKTIEYPFAYYFINESKGNKLKLFGKPDENSIVSGINDSIPLKSAFNIMPNSVFEFSYTREKESEKTEKWEAFTDAYNFKYLYCKETESVAYYVNDGVMFYFTSFYGNRNSLLYYFYLSAYKVFLGENNQPEITDTMAIHTVLNKNLLHWIHDFIAPFYNYISVNYSSRNTEKQNGFELVDLKMTSKIDISVFGKAKNESRSEILIKDKKIEGFTFENKKIKVNATCINS